MVEDSFTAALFALLIVAAGIAVLVGAFLAIECRSWAPLIGYTAIGVGGLGAVVALYVTLEGLGSLLMGGTGG